MAEQVSNFEFILKSTLTDFPEMDFSDSPVRAYSRIYFSDSIFTFYPYGEVYKKDPFGKISDKIYFIEGLEFNTKFGKINSYLEHNYLWSEDSTNKMEMHNFISGEKVFVLISAESQNDLPQSSAWNDISSNVVKDIIKNFTPVNTYISDTSGKRIWYQFNKTYKEFLMNIAAASYSDKNPIKTPFYTFFNCAGEFYFMSLEDLFAQPPVAEYKFSMNDEMVFDDFSAKDAEIHSLGLPVNKEGYNRKVFILEEDGLIKENQFLITDHFLKIDTETKLQQKLLIRQDSIKTNKIEVTDVLDLKIVESSESDFMQGRIVNMYKDSALSYRFTLIVSSNNKIVSGKIITLDIDSYDKEKKAGKATEYCGKWLILESQHYADDDGVPYTQLLLGKSGISVDTTHPRKLDFIG